MIGQLLALCSALSFAMSNVFISRTSQSGGDKGVMFSVLVTMAMSAILWIFLEAGSPTAEFTWAGIAWFALAGVFAMVLGRSLLFESVRRLGVARSAAVKRLNPFFSVLLAALFLGETIGGTDILGMVAIATGFAVLISDNMRRRPGKTPVDIAPVSYLFGVLAALAYASAYVVRKLGLDAVSAPAFGTMVSAVTGFLIFCIMSMFSTRMRSNLVDVLVLLDRWVVLAAFLVSLGQILLFAALAYEEVSTVVMIASLEIFLSIFLAVVVFRTEAPPGIPIFVAAALAMLGVVLVAA